MKHRKAGKSIPAKTGLLLFLCLLLPRASLSATPYSPADMEALVQIDKDMDAENLLNWYDPDTDSNPGDGGLWYGVVWENGRVVSIGTPASPGGHGQGGSRVNWLRGRSDAFAALTGLRQLCLSGPIEVSLAKRSGFSDIGSFQNLIHLECLEFRTLDLDDLDAIKTLKKLKTLAVSAAQPKKTLDISALSHLTELRRLVLRRQRIDTISSLSGLSELRYLDLTGNEINDIEALRNLPNMEELYLEHNAIERIDAIGKMTRLRTLSLANNTIRTVPVVKELESIQKIDLSNNTISDASNLTDLPQATTELLLNKNCLKLSQLKPLMRFYTIVFGEQSGTLMPSPLKVDTYYDISSEYEIDGLASTFSITKVNAVPFSSGSIIANPDNEPYSNKAIIPLAPREKEFELLPDGKIVFRKPGNYSVKMTNKRIYSHGTVMFGGGAVELKGDAVVYAALSVVE